MTQSVFAPEEAPRALPDDTSVIDALAWRAQEGDEEALNAVYRAMRPVVEQVASSFESDAEAAADIAAAALERVILRGIQGRLFTEGNLPGWTYKVTRNFAVDKHRRRLARANTISLEQDGILSEAEERAPTPAAETEYLDRDLDRIRTLFQAVGIGVLSGQTFCMFHFDHMTIKEISQELGVPEGTVKRRINYAKTRVRDHLKKTGRTNPWSLFTDQEQLAA